MHTDDDIDVNSSSSNSNSSGSSSGSSSTSSGGSGGGGGGGGGSGSATATSLWRSGVVCAEGVDVDAVGVGVGGVVGVCRHEAGGIEALVVAAAKDRGEHAEGTYRQLCPWRDSSWRAVRSAGSRRRARRGARAQCHPSAPPWWCSEIPPRAPPTTPSPARAAAPARSRPGGKSASGAGSAATAAAPRPPRRGPAAARYRTPALPRPPSPPEATPLRA